MSRIPVAYATDRPEASTVMLRAIGELSRIPEPRAPIGHERRGAARTWQVSADGRIEPVHTGNALARTANRALVVLPRRDVMVVAVPRRRRRRALSGLSAAVVAVGIIVAVVGGRPATAAGESVAAPVSAPPTTDAYPTGPYAADPYAVDPYAAAALPGAYALPPLPLTDPYAAAAYPPYSYVAPQLPVPLPVRLPPAQVQNLPTTPPGATLLPLPPPSATTTPRATTTTAPVATTTAPTSTTSPPPTPALAFLTGGLPVPLRPVPSGPDGLPVPFAEAGLGRWTPTAGQPRPEVLIAGTGHPVTATVRSGGAVPGDTLLTVELTDRTPRYYTLAAPVPVARAGFPALLAEPAVPPLLLLVEQADGALVVFGAVPYSPPLPTTAG